MTRFLLAAAPIALISGAAHAGEDIRYEAAPDWVAPFDFAAAMAEGEEIVAFDRHVRLEGGVVTAYSDVAFELRTADAVQRLGTRQFVWLPDKGDLIVHRMVILRDGEEIDLVAGGLQPEVIRRETSLEQRMIDGALTAVYSIPGLQVGDVLRYSVSTTTRDQALDGEMQAFGGLTAEPVRLGFGRFVMSWPKGEDISWGTVGQTGDIAAFSSDGYTMIDVALPIEEPDEMPEDAPGRFLVQPAVQAGSFGSWDMVSRVMGQHFSTEGTIDPQGPIAQEVARIAATTSDPLGRAALATRLVQDEISYLLNGLDGGNYLPQSPAETWELRYGDCKAKSLLLLAILRELDIEAEAVLVDTNNGDAASIAQPLPGAFNHMIVRAEIDGQSYWLDGTTAGTRLANIDEVPSFIYALPLREEGARLIKMEQRWPKTPDMRLALTYDYSAGIDLPHLYAAELELRGSMAANMRDAAKEDDPEQTMRSAYSFLENRIDGFLTSAEFTYDDNSGVGVLKAEGIDFDGFEFDRDNASLALFGSTTNWQFNPDRARRTWREIPYAISNVFTREQSAKYILPARLDTPTIGGKPFLDEVAAGTRFKRSVSVDGNVVQLQDSYSFVPREIAPDELTRAKADMRSLISGDPSIKITDPERYWELDDADIAQRFAVFEAPLAELIAIDPDEASYYYISSVLHMLARQHDKAVEAIDLALDEEESASYYLFRAGLLENQGRLDEALLDSERAHQLQGDLETANSYANLLALNGRAQEGLQLLDDLGLSGDDAVNVEALWSELSGHAGKADEAWTRLDQALSARPGDGTLLNSQCWLSGVWQHNLDSAGDVCDDAVRSNSYSAAVLDSRALVHYRKGDFDAAMADLDAALLKEPGMAASMYLRGIVRLAQGDNGGEQDLLHARRIVPSIDITYGQWGIGPQG